MKFDLMAKFVLFSFLIYSSSAIFLSNADATEPNTSTVDREIRILSQELQQQQNQLNILRLKSDKLTQQLQELQISQNLKIKRLEAKKQENLLLKKENETLKQKIQNYEAQLYRLSQVKK